MIQRKHHNHDHPYQDHPYHDHHHDDHHYHHQHNYLHYRDHPHYHGHHYYHDHHIHHIHHYHDFNRLDVGGKASPSRFVDDHSANGKKRKDKEKEHHTYEDDNFHDADYYKCVEGGRLRRIIIGIK